MALYSLVIECDGKSYSTQISAETARAAINEYFDGIYTKTSADAFGSNAPALSAKEIIYVKKMDGLVNMWTACAGREGKYVSIVCSRTDSVQET